MGVELLLEGEDGSRVHLSGEASFGRDSPGFNSTDPTVSRRHVAFKLDQPGNRAVPDNVPFQVIGKNPVWVRSGGQVEIFRKSEKGEVRDGDRLCVSGLRPVWFSLRVVEPAGRDGSWVGVDPVKEFGFLVIGHEFDGYCKGRRIREAKDWDWFVEEDGEVSGEDGGSGRSKGGKLGKRRRKGGGGEVEDDDWAGESEEDMEVVSKSRKVGKGKTYVTRSKDGSKGRKAKGDGKAKAKAKNVANYDEEDETLGGFIVDEDEVEEGKDVDDEEEEEEFDDDDDEEEEE